MRALPPSRPSNFRSHNRPFAQLGSRLGVDGADHLAGHGGRDDQIVGLASGSPALAAAARALMRQGQACLAGHRQAQGGLSDLPLPLRRHGGR
ncbi:hypothetical protein G6F32_015791 [Rhizopus arrhizus]|nr:hypothetical protein G6F32_015791 [Rhizopus arrhizus]